MHDVCIVAAEVHSKKYVYIGLTEEASMSSLLYYVLRLVVEVLHLLLFVHNAT